MKLVTLVLVWWFIQISAQGVASTLGPFDTREECRDKRAWTLSHQGPAPQQVSECYQTK